LPKTKIIATDISKKALVVAKKNAKTHKVKVKFLQDDLLTPIRNQRVDIIVANLPYLKKSLPFEPKKAFLAGKQGLDLYQKFFQQIIDYNLKPKFVIIEIDPRQTTKVKKIVKQYLPQVKVQTKKDLADLDRVLIIKI
jgi:release factor glutamine methyltransferase